MSDKARSGKTRGGKALSWGLFENSVGPVTFMLSSALAGRSVSALAPFALPGGSLSVLTLIHANPGCSQTDLAKTTGMSKSGVVGLIDELERRGLAARAPSTQDRRRNNLALTPKGVAQLHEMVAIQLAEEKQIQEELSADELKQLTQLLRRAYIAISGKTDN